VACEQHVTLWGMRLRLPWQKLVAALVLLEPAWRGIRWALDHTSYVDLVISKIQDPSPSYS
jgi:hypothetical protein